MPKNAGNFHFGFFGKSRDLGYGFPEISHAKAISDSRDIQESMVSSGRLIDALETLEEWLIRVEPELSERRPVEGDLDTVEKLIDQHREFKRDLEEREKSFAHLRRLASDLSAQDSAWMRPQISGLGTRWEELRTLSRKRDDKLARAKARAQEFQVSIKNLKIETTLTH